jgi:transcription initiation factor TFIIE subunit alpha
MKKSVERKPKNSLTFYLNSYIKEIYGNSGVKILNAMEQTGETSITDEALEKKTKLKISEIRSSLNHLLSYGIVNYTREKDEKTGWYTYMWKLNPSKAAYNILNRKRSGLENLRDKLSKEGTVFYTCDKNCNYLEFEEALNNRFKCPTCESKLKYVDPNVKVKLLNKKIDSLNKLYEQATQK